MTDWICRRPLLTLLAIGLLELLASAPIYAQTAQADASFSWVLSTTGCSVGISPCDNKPLTGANALTRVEAFFSTSPIPDSPTTTPVVLSAAATTTTTTLSVTNGGSIYGRFRECTATLCSDLSAQAVKPITLDVKPGVPTSVTIQITIKPAP